MKGTLVLERDLEIAWNSYRPHVKTEEGLKGIYLTKTGLERATAGEPIECEIEFIIPTESVITRITKVFEGTRHVGFFYPDMRFRFRGFTIFRYSSYTGTVTQEKIHESIPAFDYCRFIEEDYMLLSEFFRKAYMHRKKEITDIEDTDVH